MICGSHLGFVWIWYTFGIITTINTHCGYHFPCAFSPRAHDYHHEKFNEVFGVMVSERSERAFWKTRLRATTPLNSTLHSFCSLVPPASLKMRTISLRSAQGWLDTFHGTNKTWLESESYKSHEQYFTIEPPFEVGGKKKKGEGGVVKNTKLKSKKI